MPRRRRKGGIFTRRRIRRAMRPNRDKGIIVDIAKAVEAGLYSATGAGVFKPSPGSSALQVSSKRQGRTRLDETPAIPAVTRQAEALGQGHVISASQLKSPAAIKADGKLLHSGALAYAGSHHGGDGGSTSKVNFVKREIVNIEITDSTNLSVSSTVVNPGNSVTHPWLSGIANKFEKFVYHNMTIRYVPTCAATETGMVCVAFEPDPTDTNPESIQQMAAFQESYLGAVWAPGSFKLGPQSLDAKWINAKFVDSTGSLDFSKALGKILVAVEGGSGAGTTLGWVEIAYDVMLATPQFHEHSTGYSHRWATGGAANAYLDGTTAGRSDNLEDRGFEFTGTRIYAPFGYAGHFMVLLNLSASTSIGSLPAPSAGGDGSTLHANFLDSTGSWVAYRRALSGSGSAAFIATDWHLSGVGSATRPYLNIGSLGLITGTLYMNLFVMELPTDHTYTGKVAMPLGASYEDMARYGPEVVYRALGLEMPTKALRPDFTRAAIAMGRPVDAKTSLESSPTDTATADPDTSEYVHFPRFCPITGSPVPTPNSKGA
jgi:hypothetical protein